jgi:hypothetical protein
VGDVSEVEKLIDDVNINKNIIALDQIKLQISTMIKNISVHSET